MAFSFPSVYLHDMYIDNIIIYIKYSITSKIVKCEIRQLMHSFNIHVYDQRSDIKHGGENQNSQLSTDLIQLYALILWL